MKKKPVFLLIHGFTGHPASWSWMQEQLRQAGFDTYAPTLSGHGTTPAALSWVRYQDWLDDVEQAFEKVQAEYETVFVAGLSMGGALSLYLAQKYDFKGLVCLATPVRVAPWKALAFRAVSLFKKWTYKKDGPDIHDRAARSIMRSYDAYPRRAGKEFLKLIRRVNRGLNHVTVPILIMHSRQDHTIPVDNARYLYEHVASEHKKIVLLENSYHILPLDFDKEIIRDEILAFAASIAKPEKATN